MIVEKIREIKLTADAKGIEWKEKVVSFYKIEISVAVTPVQGKKEGAMPKSRKHKRDLEDRQDCVKYHKIYHIKQAKSDDGESVLPENELDLKKKKIMISKLIPDLLSYPTHLCSILALRKFAEQNKSKKMHVW